MSTFCVTFASAKVDTEITRSETVKINVALAESVSAKAGSIEFEYGNDFEFISGAWSLQNPTIKRYNASDKKGVFTFDSEHEIIGSVFVINLKSADNVALGKHNISYSLTLRNAEGESQIIHGTYKVSVISDNKSSIILGDVNGDNIVNIIDATFIQLKLEGYTINKYNKKTADTDGDGKITNQDAISIQRFLAKLTTNKMIGRQIKT